jgi:hypothetical protein
MVLNLKTYVTSINNFITNNILKASFAYGLIIGFILSLLKNYIDKPKLVNSSNKILNNSNPSSKYLLGGEIAIGVAEGAVAAVETGALIL